MKKVGFILILLILLAGSQAWALDSEIAELREKALIEEIENLESHFQWKSQPSQPQTPVTVPMAVSAKKVPSTARATPITKAKKQVPTKESGNAKLALKKAKARKKQIETEIMLLEKKLAVSRHLAERSVSAIERATRQTR